MDLGRQVVKVQYVEQMQSMQSYLARREELKVSVHPKRLAFHLISIDSSH